MCDPVSLTIAAVGVGTAAYSADQQRKGIHAQQDAANAAIAADAREKAEAETMAQVAANAKLADSKRRRRSSALGLGDPTASADTLGGAAGATALASGGTTPAARVASYYPGTSAAYAAGTALGAGSASSRSTGRVGIPKTPDRAMAV